MTAKERAHAYYKSHPDIWKALAARRYKGGKTPTRTGECKTKEGRAAYQKRYYQEHKDHLREINVRLTRERRAKARLARQPLPVEQSPSICVTTRRIQQAPNPLALLQDVVQGKIALLGGKR